jgi:hypothetical protein
MHNGNVCAAGGGSGFSILEQSSFGRHQRQKEAFSTAKSLFALGDSLLFKSEKALERTPSARAKPFYSRPMDGCGVCMLYKIYRRTYTPRRLKINKLARARFSLRVLRLFVSFRPTPARRAYPPFSSIVASESISDKQVVRLSLSLSEPRPSSLLHTAT